MRGRLWLKAAPLMMVAVLVVTACSGGGGSDDATRAPTAPGAPLATATPEPTAAPVAYIPPHSRPGPAVDKLFFKSFHVDRAPLDFQAGKMDLYLFSLKTAAARELRKDQDVRLDEAPATSVSIILNPAPAREGELNPFSIKEVRQAVQYLINRDFIANDIYQGMALPMLTHMSPGDFDFLTIFDVAKESRLPLRPRVRPQHHRPGDDGRRR